MKNKTFTRPRKGAASGVAVGFDERANWNVVNRYFPQIGKRKNRNEKNHHGEVERISRSVKKGAIFEKEELLQDH
jgi:hypothetical protein